MKKSDHLFWLSLLMLSLLFFGLIGGKQTRVEIVLSLLESAFVALLGNDNDGNNLYS